MKSSVLIMLAMLLATAILAPSVMTLTSIDKKGIAIDFNEEEKKEEKKEAKEKDFFLNSNFGTIAQIQGDKTIIASFYIESNYTTTLSIFLPPPEQNF